MRYTPTSSNQKFCTNHAYLARSMQQTHDTRHCTICQKKYRPVRTNQVVCGDKCRRAYESARDLAQRKQTYGTRECNCGAVFVPMSWRNYRCRACAALSKVPVVTAPKPEVPCLACKHGRAQPAADLGVECVVGAWTRCKPLTGATLFQPVQEAEEGAEE